MLSNEKKAEIVKNFGRKEGDTGFYRSTGCFINRTDQRSYRAHEG